MAGRIKDAIVFWMPIIVCLVLILLVFKSDAQANEKEFICTTVEDLCGWSPIDYWRLKGYEFCSQTSPVTQGSVREAYIL
ncbi:hypothetical protein [Serratia proteamaculans]|uniref:Uncharacterized protein n=1 Tax=Serratia proteamaculans TaxID=28151 RepID=A0A5Q2VCY4_SERPR|nr:hypothetical protein [Serratia proteamaculans]QGH62024.1 hypothetical protein GHV41_14840 [Serratia proteamaculans]